VNECFIITNIDGISNDIFFKPEMLKKAIQAYFFLSNSLNVDGSSSRFILSDKAMRADPSNSIEKDGFNESGDNYRMNDDITSAQIAVLATCYYVNEIVSTVSNCQSMIDELNGIDITEKEFNPFDIITV